MQELIEEMNHDTITSLHNFVESAQYVKSRAGHNGTFSSNLVWSETNLIYLNEKLLIFLCVRKACMGFLCFEQCLLE